MSGFSSLLDQFKQTTQRAAAAGGGSTGPASSSSRGRGAEAKKRSRPAFESSENDVSQRKQSRYDQSKNHPHNQQRQKEEYRFPTTPVRTIYIACPAFAETGGPEALHQLCHMINTGEYAYADSSSNSEDAAPSKYDEFGRAITANNSSGATNGSGDGGGKGAAANSAKNQNNVIKAYMLYLRERNGTKDLEHIHSPRARSSKYDRYDAPPAQSLPGGQYEYENKHFNDIRTPENYSLPQYSSDLIIWPECWTHLIDSLQPPTHDDNSNYADGRKKHQVAIWWLSVNNNKGRFLPHQFALRRDVLHLVQSAYAREYVSSNLRRGGNAAAVKNGGGKSGGEKGSGGGGDGRNVLTLTEFLPYASPTFSTQLASKEDAQQTDSNGDSNQNRDLDVVYNPAKGMHYTDEIIRRACGKKAKTHPDGSVSGGGITFSPIGKGEGGRERMTGEEVVALLKRSKVYIDFGPHPGMDRLPREAALAGCVVITNREGAADYDEDVPLPNEFKIKSFDVDKIHTILKDCCNNHGEHAKTKMKSYRKWILGQEKQMEVCVDRLVDKVVTGRLPKEQK